MTTNLTKHEAGDLWIGITMPCMNEIHAEYFETFVVPVHGYGIDPSIGQLEVRLNLSAFVRDMIAEAAKAKV